ncbi:MAG TPA: hypothetical protein VFH29_02095 [Anaerolineales bacterium]|nr:hypothetical protein [Anaerolineales bacterium]
MQRRLHSAYVLLGLLFMTACASVIPTPNDFPPPPMTPIVEFPTLLAGTATPPALPKPIFPDDMSEARTLLLILKISVSAGDSGAIAAHVKYPIQVRVNGQPTTISSAAEFERNYDGIFTRQLLDVIAGLNEKDAELQLDGVKAAGGVLWLQQFCTDAACTKGQFLITRINN